MINDHLNNQNLPVLVEHITEWHIARNLIDGTSSYAQTSKLLEEFTELVSAQMARMSGKTPTGEDVYNEVVAMLTILLERGRIKGITPENAEGELRDSLGDMGVVMINIAEREGTPLTECFAQAYHAIKDRKGRMIGGTFVKESDLPENQ